MARTKKISENKNKTDRVIKDIAVELLSALQLDGEAEVKLLEEDTYQVSINTPDSGLLIGFHGDTLSSFQLILGIMVYKKLGQWEKIVVEVGDYRAKREEQLKEMATGFANRAITTNSPVTFPYLTAADRRVIHIALKDHPQITAESIGEGEQRRLIVKPKTGQE